MVRYWRPFVVAASLVALTTSALVVAQSQEPQAPFIESITYGGSGCPGGTVGASFANNRRSFTLIFDQFVASSGSGVADTENSKDCQINVNVTAPAGTGQYCTTFDYRGYVSLPAGVSAEASSVYNGTYQLPDGQVITIGDAITHDPSTFSGPVSKDYIAREEDTWSYDNAEETTSTIVLNRRVQLSGPLAASAQITTDSVDGKLQPCNGEDTTPPSITISNPVDDGMYGVGAAVTPVFACADGDSGVASCTGAATLDTTSIGIKTFTVTAVDNAGNTNTASVSYRVGGKNECKSGGHAGFLVPKFKNQGQCVSTYAGQ